MTPPFLPSASNDCLTTDTRTRGAIMRKRKSAFLRVIEERRDAARQQAAAPEETSEDAETPRRPPWLANKRRRAPWK